MVRSLSRGPTGPRRGTLAKKLLRDMRENAMQFIAMILLCFLGTWVFSGLDGTWRLMDLTVETYFEECALADFWVNAAGLTRQDLDRIAHVEGVAAVQPRTSLTVDVEDLGDDVEAELEDSIYSYRELLHQEKIELEYLPPDGDLPVINGDPDRLRQVFLNILDNAAKYGREGGRIVVEIGSDDRWVWIKIRDFGPGVPEDELENVKKKFYKGKTKERGSGIGLAVVDEIVRYHNGTLTLENAEGGGLLVTVKLPIE